MKRLRIDRGTAGVLIAGMAVLNLLVFSAGWLVGGTLSARSPGPVVAATPCVEPGGGALSCAAGEGRGGVFRAASKEPLPVPPPRRSAGEGVTTRSTEPARAGFAWASPLADVALFTMPVPAKSAPRRVKVSLDLIHQAALSHALPPALVEAVARVESGLNPRALSPKGARGLMQVMPATGRRFGVKADRLFEPEHNLAAGAAYLAWLMDRFDDNLDFALAAYNAGEGAVDDYGGIPPYRETQDYVRRVRAALKTIEARGL